MVNLRRTHYWRICDVCRLVALWLILGWELCESDLFYLFLGNGLLHGYTYIGDGGNSGWLRMHAITSSS